MIYTWDKIIFIFANCDIYDSFNINIWGMKVKVHYMNLGDYSPIFYNFPINLMFLINSK